MYHINFNWAVPCENVSSSILRAAKALIRLRICAVWSGPSLSANRKFGLQNFITKGMNGEQRRGWDLAHAQDDVIWHILRMLQSTFFAWHGSISIISLDKRSIPINDCIVSPRTHMSRVKRKCAFKHAQNVRIHIHHACAKSHPSICSPLMHSVVTNVYVSGQRRPW